MKSEIEMRQIMKKMYCFLFCLCFTITILAQPINQDSTHFRDVKALVIIYDITYHNNKPLSKSGTSYNKAITMISGSKVNTAFYTESGDIHYTLSNDYNENCFQLFPKQQFMIKTNRSEKPSLPANMKMNQTISNTNQTKHIMDYDCSEFTIVSETQIGNFNSTITTYLYTYDSFKNYKTNYTSVKGVTGLLFGFDVDSSNGQIWRARSITEQNVDSTLFDIPKGYTVYSNAEYTQKLSTDKSFQKEMNKEFGINDKVFTVSKWKTFFDILLKVTPDILRLTTDVINNNSGNKTASSSNISTNSESSKKDNSINSYLDNEANKIVEQANKSSDYYYDDYRKRAEKEEADSEYYKNHGDNVKAANCLIRAKEYREKAEIYKPK